MAKYNVGDKVKVRSDLSFAHGAIQTMIDKYAGKVVTIAEVDPVTLFGVSKDTYHIEEEYIPSMPIFRGYIWSDKMFEGLASECENPAPTEEKKPNPMPELVNGMFGKDVEGNLFIVVNDLLIYEKGTYDYLSDIENGVVTVDTLYAPGTKKEINCFNKIKVGRANVVWERGK